MKETQSARILAYLKRGHTLTPLDALRQFGCNRLAARICELRKEGWDIRDEMIAVKTWGGDTAHVAEYRLIKPGCLF